MSAEVSLNDTTAELLRLYVQMVPAAQLIDRLSASYGPEEGWLSQSAQDEFASRVITHPHCQRYPPSKQYRKHILKLIMTEVERRTQYHSGELSEVLLACLAESACSDENRQPLSRGSVHLRATEDEESNKAWRERMEMFDLCFATYLQPGDDVNTDGIVLRIARKHNEVGLRVWEAGLFLSEYILSNKSLFNGARVLELGAGVGISGIMLAAYCQPEMVYATDCSPDVVKCLGDNIALNQKRYGETGKIHTLPAQAAYLDWNEWSESMMEHYRADIILGADICYDKSQIPGLVTMLESAIARGPRQVKGYMATTIRNESTFALLIDELSRTNLLCSDITESALRANPRPIFYYTNRKEIRLFELSHKKMTNAESSS